MKRDDYIKFCRYYKGEEKSPYIDKDQDKDLLWFYERCWVIDMESESSFPPTLIGEYVRVGLGQFESLDGVPISLKAFLFNRYARGSYSLFDAVEPFKKFYLRYYTLF